MRNNHRLNRTLIAGHFISNFDNMLYGYFAVFLADIFFPKVYPATSVLFSFAAFAAGFVARPFGALFYGLIGDKMGRKKALLSSVTLIGLPTFIIGIIPEYNSIGLAAPTVLILCRILQGFFMGGSFAGANLYVSESETKKQIGTNTGNLISVGVLGAVFATVAGAIVTAAVMPAWAWRLPFIIGGLMAFAPYIGQKRLAETYDFTKDDQKLISTSPWLHLLKKHKQHLLLSICIAGLTLIPLYCATIFGNKMFKDLGYTPAQSMLLNLAAMLVNVVIIIAYGRLSDILGFRRQILLGSASVALIMFPAFYLLSGEVVSPWQVYTFISALILTGGIINGCAMPYIASFYPIKVRYSALATSVSVGQALLGGTTPFICAIISDVSGNTIAVGFWGFFIALSVFFGVLIFDKKKILPSPSTPLTNVKCKLEV